MISKVSVAVTATLVAAAASRRWALLQNQSDTDIYVSLDGTSGVTINSGASPGHLIRPGEAIAIAGSAHMGATDPAIYAIHGGAGTKTLVCQTN
jgi:acetyl esterase/lipase